MLDEEGFARDNLLKYSHMRKAVFTLAVLSVMAVFASPVTTLPEPDAQGYYVFGSPYTYSGTDSYSWKSAANTPDYPVWSDLNLPSGSKVKLTGGVILDSFPAGVSELETSGLTFLAVTQSNIANLSGLKIVIPSGAKLCICKGTITVADNVVSFAESTNNAMTLPCDLELNGTLYWHKNTLTLSGAVSGAGTVIASTQLNFHLKYTGTISGSVNIQGTGAASQDFWVMPTSGDVSMGKVYVCGKAAGSSYFIVKPGYDDSLSPMTLTLDRFEAGGGDSSRVGTFFNIAGNRTANIGMLTGALAYFQTADSMTNVESDEMGGAKICIDNINPAGKASGNTTGTYYLSKNMSYDIGGIGTDLTKASNLRTINLSYQSYASGINTNSLSIGAMPTGSSAAWQKAKIIAPSPALLPRTITLPDNSSLSSGVNVELTENAWSFDFDFTKDDPCAAASAIENEYALSVPATGTIAVTVPVGSGAAKPVAGTYPLLTCTAHGAALDAENWPATINGVVGESVKYASGVELSLVRGATGVSLSVVCGRKNGMVIVFR